VIHMKKIILLISFLTLIIFLVSACAKVESKDVVGESSEIPGEDNGHEDGVSDDHGHDEGDEQTESVTNQVPAKGSNDAEEIVVESADKEALVDEKVSDVVEIEMEAKRFEFVPQVVEINKGDKVKLTITSTDVAHGISIPEYGISERLPVGQPVDIEFTADKEGEFTTICNVFCGSGHSKMKGKIIVK
jgi:cytochrome c oxidase subunit II